MPFHFGPHARVEGRTRTWHRVGLPDYSAVLAALLEGVEVLSCPSKPCRARMKSRHRLDVFASRCSRSSAEVPPESPRRRTRSALPTHIESNVSTSVRGW